MGSPEGDDGDDEWEVGEEEDEEEEEEEEEERVAWIAMRAPATAPRVAEVSTVFVMGSIMAWKVEGCLSSTVLFGCVFVGLTCGE